MAIQPKFYETLYLVRPDINSDDLATIQEKVTKAINSDEGEITRDEKWAERDLAYPIDDYTRGTYYIVEFKAFPRVIANIEKHLAFHNVDVLRFMTVSVDEPSAKAADTPAPTTTKSTPKESTPAPSTPAPSTPPSAPAASPQAESKPAETPPAAPSAAPESAPVEEPPAAPSAPETTPPAESTTKADTPPESAPEATTSDSSSGFTAAPPLSTEDKDSGGEK